MPPSRLHRNNFSAAPGNVDQLIRRLAGSSSPTTVVPGFYDRRYRVGVSGGVVDTIDDARGATGFGPQIIFAGAARPAWNATTLVATFDGTDDYGATATVAAFDLNSTKTLILGAAFTETTAGRYAATIRNAAVSFYVAVDCVAGPFIGTEVGASDFKNVSSTVAPSATRRLIVAAASPASTVYTQVPAAAQATIAHTNAMTSASYALTLGGLSASAFADFVWLFTIVLNRLYTTADKDLIAAWAQKNHATVNG